MASPISAPIAVSFHVPKDDLLAGSPLDNPGQKIDNSGQQNDKGVVASFS
jgi:hypothetical protein